MSRVTNLHSAALAIKDFEGVPKEGEAAKASFVVILDMATVLAGELPATRAKYSRKLTAMLRAGDKLSLWFARGTTIFGEYCAEVLINDPAKDVPDLIEKYVTDENFQGGSEDEQDMAGAAASIARSARKEKRNLIGYTFIDGFTHTSVYIGMATVAQYLVQDCNHFFVGEYSYGDQVSEAWTVFSESVGLRCVYSRDQLDEDTSFEEAIARIAGYSPRPATMEGASPQDEYGFLTYLVGNRVMATPVNDDDMVLLPAGVNQFGYFSDEVTEGETDFFPQLEHSPLFWATLALAPSLDEDLDFPAMLNELGDVFLIHMFHMGVEEGDMHRYELACLEAAFNPNCRYKQGMAEEAAHRAVHSPMELEAAQMAGESLSSSVEDDHMPTLLQPWTFALVFAVLIIGAAYTFFG